MSNELNIYSDLLVGIKNRVRQGQIKAYVAVNAELLATYWDIGKMIHERQQLEGWGKGVIPRLAIDLKNELSEVKGFSERNILRMLTFYKEYQSLTIWQLPVAKLKNDETSISPLPVAKLENSSNSISPTPLAKLESIDEQVFNKVSWSHHSLLIQKVKDVSARFWYMQQIVEQGWSYDTLNSQIKSKVHERQGTLVHNFDATLPDIHSQWAKNLFKDPYIFDFTTLATEFTERELELNLVQHVEKFLVELGAGFAFIGRQYKLKITLMNWDYELGIV